MQLRWVKSRSEVKPRSFSRRSFPPSSSASPSRRKFRSGQVSWYRILPSSLHRRHRRSNKHPLPFSNTLEIRRASSRPSSSLSSLRKIKIHPCQHPSILHHQGRAEQGRARPRGVPSLVYYQRTITSSSPLLALFRSSISTRHTFDLDLYYTVLSDLQYLSLILSHPDRSRKIG